MSVALGKFCVIGQAVVRGEKRFVLKFLQSCNHRWSEKGFFAKFDPTAVLFDDLKPAFGRKDFFFTYEYGQQKQMFWKGSSSQLSDADLSVDRELQDSRAS